MPKAYVNPPTLFGSQQYGFSQIVTTRGATTIYLSGLVGWDAQQQIVGKDELGKQTHWALQIIETALEAVSASRDDVVSLRIYLVDVLRPCPPSALAGC